MIDYLASFANTNGLAFPNTKAVNASAPTSTDGTEFVKIFIDDLWGSRQAIMDYAGLAPNGLTEEPGQSQVIEAISKGFSVGPGQGVVYWKNGDPAVNGDRVLLLQGQGIVRANYPELDAAVYVGDGNNNIAAAFYRADDAAGTIRNIAGVYLILPECRGRALRGLDTSGVIDPDGIGRTLGDTQGDRNQSHDHTLNDPGHDHQQTIYSQLVSVQSGAGANLIWSSTTDAAVTTSFTGITMDLQGGADARMKNVSCKFGITY